MSHMLLTDSRLFELILKIDADTVAATRAGSCPHCEGPLDQAYYPRKPRGLPATLESAFMRRPSFCCRRDGCRTRLTPTLIGFLGRRVYVSVVVVLAAALRQGCNPRRLGDLHRLIGVSARTVRRWLAWWRYIFPASDFWREKRAALVPPVDDAGLPRVLFERLALAHGNEFIGLSVLLRLLAS